MATNTSDAMAAFLARGGTITQCGSTKQQALSLRTMRRREEAGTLWPDDTPDEETDAEQAAELRMEKFGRARASGLSMEAALDESR